MGFANCRIQRFSFPLHVYQDIKILNNLSENLLIAEFSVSLFLYMSKGCEIN